MRAPGFAQAAVAPLPRSANGAGRLPNGSARYLPCCRSGWPSLPPVSRSCCNRHTAAVVGIMPCEKQIAVAVDAAAAVVADRRDGLKVAGCAQRVRAVFGGARPGGAVGGG